MQPHDPKSPVVVVGAGLAGLACAKTLSDRGIPVRVFDRAERVGGRVVTDEVDGFLLDRGFQVLLTAYPEAMKTWSLEDLDLRNFYPGALVQIGERRYRFGDPLRRPAVALSTMTAPISSFRDAAAITLLRSKRRTEPEPDSAEAQPTTLEFLRARGMSERVIDRFFRPFFGGVFLDRDLGQPSWLFEFLFAMFSQGHAALPARGMGVLPDQLAAQLPPECFALGTGVSRVEDGRVLTDDDEWISAQAVVVAADAEAAGRLLPELPEIEWNGGTTVYYAAPKSPIEEGILVIDGDGVGPVNHVCVPSDLSSAYAPDGQALISASIVGCPDVDDETLDRTARSQLKGWFGDPVEAWRHLRTYRIPHALPRMSGSRPSSTSSPDGLFLCGDYRTDPSIDGALRSGRRTAEKVGSFLADRFPERLQPEV